MEGSGRQGGCGLQEGRSGRVEARISVGPPEGTFACTMSAGDTHLASTAPDVRSFERVLKERLVCRVRESDP